MTFISLIINILYAILLVAGGLVSIPTGSGPGVPDVVLHGLAYGLQAALLFWLFSSKLRTGRAIIAGVVCATLFGAMVESLQLFQPARAVQMRDLLANAIGACIVGTVIALIGRRRS